MNTNAKKILTILILIVIAALGVIFVGPRLMNSDTVKARLIDAARASLDADLTVASLDIDAGAGRIRLGRTTLKRNRPSELVDIEFQSAQMTVRMLPLLFKKVHIENLEIESPSIKIVSKQKAKRPSNGQLPEPTSADQRIKVDKITIRNGQLDYSASTPDNTEQTTVLLNDIDYTATYIMPQTLPRLLSAAKLSVGDVQLMHTDAKSNLELTAEKLTVDNDPAAANISPYRIDTVEIFAPKISYFIQRQEETPAPGTKDKIINLINDKLKDSGRSQTPKNAEQFKYSIADFIVHNGQIEYTATRKNAPRFDAKMSNLQYHARNIDYRSFGNLVINADIQADILMQTKARLSKKRSGNTRTFDLIGANLAHIDKYFSQTDALIIKDGRMDIKYKTYPGGKGKYEVILSDFQLAKNESCPSDEFMFIPVAKIIEQIDKRKGSLDLWFELDSEFDVSDDLDSITTDFWNGMWKALIKSITSEALKQGAQS